MGLTRRRFIRAGSATLLCACARPGLSLSDARAPAVYHCLVAANDHSSANHGLPVPRAQFRQRALWSPENGGFVTTTSNSDASPCRALA